MEKKARLRVYRVQVDAELIETISNEAAAWHESPEEVQKGLAHGKEKAALEAWIRTFMDTGLTERERHCLELYYFRNMTYREAGAATGTNATSVYRAVLRALRKLRITAEAEGLEYRGLP
jgi:RNA polymerase sigma factor (sigma-70 family)